MAEKGGSTDGGRGGVRNFIGLFLGTKVCFPRRPLNLINEVVMHCHDHETVLTGQKVPPMSAMISSYIKRNNQVDKLKCLQEDFPFGLQGNFPSQFFYFLSFHVLPEFTQT